MRSPLTAESQFRKLLRAECRPLGSLTLGEALRVASSFYRSVRDFETDGEDGDGFVVYEDVTKQGGGTRLEVGIVRAFCLPDNSPSPGRRSAVRLRLRCCYKFDLEITSEVLSEPTWSLYCWSPANLEALVSAAQEKAAFKKLSSRKAAAVHISTEQTSYFSGGKNPRSDAKQMWWAVADVA